MRKACVCPVLSVSKVVLLAIGEMAVRAFGQAGLGEQRQGKTLEAQQCSIIFQTRANSCKPYKPVLRSSDFNSNMLHESRGTEPLTGKPQEPNRAGTEPHTNRTSTG